MGKCSFAGFVDDWLALNGVELGNYVVTGLAADEDAA